MTDLEQKMLERLERQRQNAEDSRTRSGLAREILQAQLAIGYLRKILEKKVA